MDKIVPDSQTLDSKFATEIPLQGKTGFFIANPAGQLLEANNFFLHRTGYNQQELLAGSIYCADLMDADSWIRIQQSLHLLHCQSFIEPFSIQFKSKSGKTNFPGIVSVTNVRDGSGSGIFTVQILENIATPQEATAFSIISKEMPELIAALDMQGYYIAFSPSYQNYFQNHFAVSLQVGDSLAEALAHRPTEQKKALTSWNLALQGETRIEQFNVNVTSGEPRLFEATYSPLLENGKQNGAYMVARDINRQQILQKALKSEELRFCSVFDTSFQMISILAPDGTLLKLNNAAFKVFHVFQEEILGKPFWDCQIWNISQEAKEQLRVAIEKAAKGFISSYESEICNAQNLRIPIEFSIKPVLDEQGQIPMLIVEMLIITEQRMAQSEILRLNYELNRRFDAAFEQAVVGFAHVGAKGELLRINQKYCNILGYSREEIVGIDFTSLLLAENKEHTKALHQQFFQREQKEFSVDTQFVHKNGSIIWIHLTVVSITNEQGIIEYKLIVAEDITQRKQMEDALRESETHWRELGNALPIIIWVTNDKGVPIFTNEQWFQYIGRPSHSVDLSWIEWIHPDDQQRILTEWQAQVKAGGRLEIEVRYRNSTGQYRWHLVRGIPFRNKDGIVSWYGTCIDIHDRRMMEEDLGKARDIAEQANREKSQFLANMSHELRTPLNAVIGFSDMLKEGMGGPLTDKQQGYLEYIAISGKHLLAMVNDILDVSKLEAGKIELMLEYIELVPFIKQLQALMRFSASKNSVWLDFDIQQGLSGFVADPERLRQIFVNLIENAIKFNHKGGKVHVSLGYSPDQQWVICEVQDSGIGIPADKIPQLFTQFYQVDSSDTRRYEGTGLGLALTKKLVELHHGSILVESQEGVGSIFTVKLPVSP